MFLERFSRFFRQYELTFQPRHQGGAYLPIVAGSSAFSVMDALQKRIAEEQALQPLANGDLVELMSATPDIHRDALVLLFHKTSPNAADPTYRLKARKRVTIRKVTKNPGEEQAVSAHLIISQVAYAKGRYRAVLEEIPGLSMGALQPIIGQALQAYPYKFASKRGQKEDTYTVFKPEGVKSETITNAIRTGHLREVKLVRPARPDFVDADGIFTPVTETMRLKVNAEKDLEGWKALFSTFVKAAKSQGWEDFNIEIDFNDNRQKTVKLDREQDAKEVLFVRSELVQFRTDLAVCSNDIVDEIVEKAVAMMAGAWGAS